MWSAGKGERSHAEQPGGVRGSVAPDTSAAGLMPRAPLPSRQRQRRRCRCGLQPGLCALSPQWRKCFVARLNYIRYLREGVAYGRPPHRRPLGHQRSRHCEPPLTSRSTLWFTGPPCRPQASALGPPCWACRAPAPFSCGPGASHPCFSCPSVLPQRHSTSLLATASGAPQAPVQAFNTSAPAGEPRRPSWRSSMRRSTRR